MSPANPTWPGSVNKGENGDGAIKEESSDAVKPFSRALAERPALPAGGGAGATAGWCSGRCDADVAAAGANDDDPLWEEDRSESLIIVPPPPTTTPEVWGERGATKRPEVRGERGAEEEIGPSWTSPMNSRTINCNVLVSNLAITSSNFNRCDRSDSEIGYAYSSRITC